MIGCRRRTFNCYLTNLKADQTSSLRLFSYSFIFGSSNVETTNTYVKGEGNKNSKPIARWFWSWGNWDVRFFFLPLPPLFFGALEIYSLWNSIEQNESPTISSRAGIPGVRYVMFMTTNELMLALNLYSYYRPIPKMKEKRYVLLKYKTKFINDKDSTHRPSSVHFMGC